MWGGILHCVRGPFQNICFPPNWEDLEQLSWLNFSPKGAGLETSLLYAVVAISKHFSCHSTSMCLLRLFKTALSTPLSTYCLHLHVRLPVQGVGANNHIGLTCNAVSPLAQYFFLSYHFFLTKKLLVHVAICQSFAHLSKLSFWELLFSLLPAPVSPGNGTLEPMGSYCCS